MSAREGSFWLLSGKSKTKGKLPAVKEITSAMTILPVPLALPFQAVSQGLKLKAQDKQIKLSLSELKLSA